MLDRLERQYSYNGFSPAERIDLQRRLRDARQDLRLADNGSWDRNDRYAWDEAITSRRYTGRGGPENDWLGLRIGQRATGDLVTRPGQVPDALSRRRSGVYYRSDGHMIYEIDARTNLVLNAYPAD